MMQHGEYTLLMSLVLDEEASDDEAARLREHLRACDDCGKTWQRWREVDRRLTLAPTVPAPVDFAAVVLGRLDPRVAEERRRRWLIAGLAAAWVGTVAFAVVALGVANGWHLLLAPEQGPLAAAWAGLTSTGGWALREVRSALGSAGAPVVAAATGALLCLTCALAMMWLWVVARVGAGPQGWAAAN